MIFRNAFEDAPLLSVNIQGSSIPDTQIAIVELMLAENKHDMAVITFSGFPGEAVTAFRGLPVTINLGNNEANMINFFGYVGYVEFEALTRMGKVNNSNIQAARVVCFGSSYDMKTVRSTSYQRKTILDIVKLLANKYNFSYSVPNNQYVFSLVEQSEKSDWELLVELANTVGYYVQVRGTHIHVYDPFSSYFRSLPPTELSNQAENVNVGKERRPGNIYEFRGTFGDVTPDGSTSQWILKSLDVTGKEIQYSLPASRNSGLGSPVERRFTNEVTFNATSSETLRQFAEKYIKQEFPVNADAVVMGTSGAMPGRLAQVSNYNSKFDGLWLIAEATHIVNNSHYITNLKLKTDSTNEKPPQGIIGATYREPPAPRLVGNLWQRSREFSYVY
jgi:hypothetical protein